MGNTRGRGVYYRPVSAYANPVCVASIELQECIPWRLDMFLLDTTSGSEDDDINPYLIPDRPQ